MTYISEHFIFLFNKNELYCNKCGFLLVLFSKVNNRNNENIETLHYYVGIKFKIILNTPVYYYIPTEGKPLYGNIYIKKTVFASVILCLTNNDISEDMATRIFFDIVVL